MKSFIAVSTFLGLAAAQFTDVNGTFICATNGGAYCPGGSGSSFIIRCDGTAGYAGNCNDNLAGYPPAGGFATCKQTSMTSGDAVCCKGTYCQQPIPIVPNNSTTTTTVTTSSTSSTPYPYGNTTTTTIVGPTGSISKPLVPITVISTSTGTGGAIGGSTTTGTVTSTSFVSGSSAAASTSTTTGLVTVIPDGQPQASTPASSLVSTSTVVPYAGNGAGAAKIASGVIGAAAVAFGALLV